MTTSLRVLAAFAAAVSCFMTTARAAAAAPLATNAVFTPPADPIFMAGHEHYPVYVDADRGARLFEGSKGRKKGGKGKGALPTEPVNLKVHVNRVCVINGKNQRTRVLDTHIDRLPTTLRIPLPLSQHDCSDRIFSNDERKLIVPLVGAPFAVREDNHLDFFPTITGPRAGSVAMQMEDAQDSYSVRYHPAKKQRHFVGGAGWSLLVQRECTDAQQSNPVFPFEIADPAQLQEFQVPFPENRAVSCFDKLILMNTQTAQPINDHRPDHDVRPIPKVEYTYTLIPQMPLGNRPTIEVVGFDHTNNEYLLQFNRNFDEGDEYWHNMKIEILVSRSNLKLDDRGVATSDPMILEVDATEPVSLFTIGMDPRHTLWFDTIELRARDTRLAQALQAAQYRLGISQGNIDALAPNQLISDPEQPIQIRGQPRRGWEMLERRCSDGNVVYRQQQRNAFCGMHAVNAFIANQFEDRSFVIDQSFLHDIALGMNAGSLGTFYEPGSGNCELKFVKQSLLSLPLAHQMWDLSIEFSGDSFEFTREETELVEAYVPRGDGFVSELKQVKVQRPILAMIPGQWYAVDVLQGEKPAFFDKVMPADMSPDQIKSLVCHTGGHYYLLWKDTRTDRETWRLIDSSTPQPDPKTKRPRPLGGMNYAQLRAHAQAKCRSLIVLMRGTAF